MTDHTSFAIRILAEVARVAAWTTRGFLAAVGADPAAVLALGVLLLVVTLSLPLALRTLVVAERWVARHLAAHRKQAAADAVNNAFAEIVEHEPELAKQLAAVRDEYRLASPPPRRELHRRPRRFPGRRLTRRSTTSSSFDRGHHS
jgi:hypothetical protein